MLVTPYLVGIDLGTTNSACAFVDTRLRGGRVELFQIPQLIEPFVVAPRPLLPSFLYFGQPHEIEGGALALPWNGQPEVVAGVLARERGALAPARQVSSAKSWLAHPGVDRRAAILPWGGTDKDPRISPVDASTRYLAHLRDAWNSTLAGSDSRLRLEQQMIVLTVPASFDEEARELTVQSARDAGLAHLTLLEEPIAAFYAWLAEHATDWAGMFGDEQIALVCDVGGGTTDFSLIRVRIEQGSPTFERIAIGDHLLLGGDNVDVALALLLERRILETRTALRLTITQRSALGRLCSAAKERILDAGPATDRVAITILGAGRAVVGEAITTELTRQDVERTLAEFLPITRPDELAAPRDRRAGLRELGLPYEVDPAITRHLAAFLARSAAALPGDHRAAIAVGSGRMVAPDLVLYNGGFFTPRIARERLAHALAAWLGEPPGQLATHHLEAAVAIGAATYARVRAGVGPPLALVKAGVGRAYYIGLRAPRTEDGTAAVCVLARGADEGTVTRIEHAFTVTTNRPVSFWLYSSTIRSDSAGAIVSIRLDEEAHEHAPLVSVLRYGRKSRQVDLPVRLSVTFTEVGTLELWCESQVSDHRWRVQFQLREPLESYSEGAAPSDAAETEERPSDAAVAVVPEQAVADGEAAIRSVFTDPTSKITSEHLVAHLEQVIGYGKSAWPLGAIRRFADVLIAVADGRRRSPALEARWLNLFGFCLRPGFGATKDAWRVTEARKIYAAGLTFGNTTQNRAEWLVLLQRVAGGFAGGQQRELGQRVMGELGLTGRKAIRFNPQVERESWRVLATLERLDASLRVTIGNELLKRVRRDPDNISFLWAIARLGARVPLYGPLSSVVPPVEATRWLEGLIAIKRIPPELGAAIVQIGARTGDPMRDLDEPIISRARQRLEDAGFDETAIRPLLEVVAVSSADADRRFGEPLPDGLQLQSA
jgi:hypothetical protein